MEGWICPRCGKALAPWVMECDCKPQITLQYTTTTLMQCGICPEREDNVYTSIPPRYRCKKTGEYHLYGDICNAK